MHFEFTCRSYGGAGHRAKIMFAGRKIAPNTGANATKVFTLATKSSKLVAKLATRISNHTLRRDIVIVEDL